MQVTKDMRKAAANLICCWGFGDGFDEREQSVVWRLGEGQLQEIDADLWRRIGEREGIARSEMMEAFKTSTSVLAGRGRSRPD